MWEKIEEKIKTAGKQNTGLKKYLFEWAQVGLYQNLSESYPVWNIPFSLSNEHEIANQKVYTILHFRRLPPFLSASDWSEFSNTYQLGHSISLFHLFEIQEFGLN